MTTNSATLFVPGRLCLFGEHSDWAGAYRRMNSSIVPGMTIVSGTNQGLYATAEPLDDRVEYVYTDSKAVRRTLSVSTDPGELRSRAAEGGFFSYVTGVAYQVVTHHQVGGIRITNTSTTLPIKKGLSSSAAVCVLMARAFNQIYNLRLTTRGEMDLAYRGEITTPSRCGRMDQACAYGTPVLMRFDGDLLDVDPLRVGAHFPLLIVDLHGNKDTIEILRALNHAYPFPDTDQDRAAQEYLGQLNSEIVTSAVGALQNGDRTELGNMMTTAQVEFDRALAPLCPAELNSPILHALLEDDRVHELTFGGKGVGSQGDGSAQFIARSTRDRELLSDYLTAKKGMTCLPLDLAP
jgi:galactokinase